MIKIIFLYSVKIPVKLRFFCTRNVEKLDLFCCKIKRRRGTSRLQSKSVKNVCVSWGFLSRIESVMSRNNKSPALLDETGVGSVEETAPGKSARTVSRAEKGYSRRDR